MIAIEILKLPSLGIEDIGYTLEWICMALLPNYCFTRCLQDIYLNYQTIASCRAFGESLIGTLESSCEWLKLIERTQSCCKGNLYLFSRENS